ncbi:MAG: hypothetical protein J5789_04790 [Oscillospiraceae bacterium]|nr:hypothetical protein [Oscillospiraceae bacterium]
MASLRSKTNRFFFKNRDKGIRNLMLYIGIGNVIVYFLTLLNPENPLFIEYLRFDFTGLLSGQVWRLFTYPLIYLSMTSSPLLGFLTLFFFYWCGTVLEQYWGTLRLNLYYLCGIVFTDLAALLIGMVAKAEMGSAGSSLSGLLIANAAYVNMSLLLAAATVLPDEQVRLYFVIPVKMKWLAWLDIGYTLYKILDMLLIFIRLRVGIVSPYLLLLVPLVAIANYLLFFGKQAAAILPDFIRYRPTRESWKRAVKQGTVYHADQVKRSGGARTAARGDNARFRCTICGRTELTNPKLEFRYCSKCAGYRCYCQDHIQNHAHITE